MRCLVLITFLAGSTLTALTVDSALARGSWFALVMLMIGIFLAGFAVLGSIRLETKRERVASGLCLACGYDLRASPERCPECGTAAQGA